MSGGSGLPWLCFGITPCGNPPWGSHYMRFGRPPSTVLSYIPKMAKTQAVEYFYERDRMKEVLMDNLTKAREHMKSFTDKHWTERAFEVGDVVLLKLQSYCQFSSSYNPTVNPLQGGPCCTSSYLAITDLTPSWKRLALSTITFGGKDIPRVPCLSIEEIQRASGSHPL